MTNEVVIDVNRSESHVEVATNVTNETPQQENLKITLPSVSLDSLAESLLSKMEESGISLDEKSLMTIVRYGMEVVELHNLDGESKKQFVLELVKKIATEQLDAEKASVITHLVDSGIVESTITLLISASKGELDINKVKEEAVEVAEEVIEEVAAGCFTACLKALSKRN